MKNTILSAITYLVCGLIAISLPLWVYNKGTHENFMKEAATAIGNVEAVVPGFILVDFNKPIINPCGDTEIFAFITGPEGLPLQLKPVFLPEAKAADFISAKGHQILFPILDVMVLLGPGKYKVEVFVKNTCGIGEKAFNLAPFYLELGGE